MSASLVGSEMCIRDRPVVLCADGLHLDEHAAHPLESGPSGCETIGRVGTYSPARDDPEHPGGGEPKGRAGSTSPAR
eukprot:764722-Alexandrium_andersonii.AAC.1